jgi:hypothetical protein
LRSSAHPTSAAILGALVRHRLCGSLPLPVPSRRPNTHSAFPCAATRSFAMSAWMTSSETARPCPVLSPRCGRAPPPPRGRPCSLVPPPRGLLAADVAVARPEQGGVPGGLHAALEAADVLHLAEMSGDERHTAAAGARGLAVTPRHCISRTWRRRLPQVWPPARLAAPAWTEPRPRSALPRARQPRASPAGPLWLR